MSICVHVGALLVPPELLLEPDPLLLLGDDPLLDPLLLLGDDPLLDPPLLLLGDDPLLDPPLLLLGSDPLLDAPPPLEALTCPLLLDDALPLLPEPPPELDGLTTVPPPSPLPEPAEVPSVGLGTTCAVPP